MSDVAISVENIGKQYHIGRRLTRSETLRDTLADAFTAPFRRAGKLLRGQATGAAELDETIWALKDVSFDIKRGEVVGIIGRNGAGKSTLLKILSRITEPTTGCADIYGRVGSLLEVGTGFHHELTGRENIYLNGAILGMKRVEIDSKFDEIVAFSGVERFIDTPVKHYSSGMYLRLAFSVAAHLEPEILLVDEVLAVGDATFQKKCLGKMGSVAEEGRTVLFVSHNMGAITQLCERALLLDEGRLKHDGPSADVVEAYLSSALEGQSTWTAPAFRNVGIEVALKYARLLSADGKPTTSINFDDQCLVEIAYEVNRPVRNLFVGIRVSNIMGNDIFESMDTDTTGMKGCVREPGQYVSVCEIPAQMLKPGHYLFTVFSFIERVKMIEDYENVLTLNVSPVGYRLSDRRRGAVTPMFRWEITPTNGTEPVRVD